MGGMSSTALARHSSTLKQMKPVLFLPQQRHPMSITLTILIQSNEGEYIKCLATIET
jgi:hypothetical protein